MNERILIVIIALCTLSCGPAEKSTLEAEPVSPGLKSDRAQHTDIDWANQFFLTQIYDERWNPSGIESDIDSNSCGPASLAMVLREQGTFPDQLGAQQAIDYARALMHPEFPDIDETNLPENATLYTEDGLIFVEDNTRPVYFDLMTTDPSIPQGVLHSGGTPVFGYSWDELDGYLENYGSVIAYGHITQSWRGRFPGDYGDFGSGAIPHFIALFPASSGQDIVVCDPMHRGGSVMMTQSELQTFFKSPVNVYDTTIRLVAWPGAPESGK